MTENTDKAVADVLQEFTRWRGYPHTETSVLRGTTMWYDTDAMAREIVSLRQQVVTLLRMP